MAKTWSGKSYTYNVLCPVCGFKKKNFEMKKRWDGLFVCKDDWEVRHPLDFYRSRLDAHLLPFTYPDNDGIDVSPGAPTNPIACNVFRQQGIFDQGTFDCAKFG